MSALTRKLLPFLAWRSRVNRQTLRADLVAGLISALMVLPQGVAFATLAGLPPAYGLYAAMLPAIVGALWGSSWHLVSGPTNATSLMVYASLSALAIPFSDDYVRLALTLNLMLGVTKLALGIARLGGLTNFVSQTVVVGFTAGAALLIIAAQLRNFLGLVLPASSSFAISIQNVATHLRETEPWAVAVGVTTLGFAMISQRLSRRLPHLLVGLLAGSLLGWWLNRSGLAHLATVGALPSALPSFSMPDMHPSTFRLLAPACLALTLIGLTEAISSSRAVALRSGQRLDANQEVIGQGLANVVGAFSSSYPSSGSFNRTGANYAAGAQTPLATVFSAFILVGVLVLVAPLAAYMPIAAMAGLLFLVAAGLIDIAAIRRIARTSRGEALVLAVTFVATLIVQLEFAIFVGVLASLLVYLKRTTHPRLTPIGPDPASVRRHLAPTDDGAPDARPSILMLRVDGSLFFGAVEHVGDALDAIRRAPGAPAHIVLIGSGMNFIDVAGAELLLQEARRARDAGSALYLCSLKPPVWELLDRGGYLDAFGRDRVFETREQALERIEGMVTALPPTPVSASARNP
ncbi:MAG: SulP family inorganic anion transporter [Betaproteobacteria bacterium]